MSLKKFLFLEYIIKTIFCKKTNKLGKISSLMMNIHILRLYIDKRKKKIFITSEIKKIRKFKAWK